MSQFATADHDTAITVQDRHGQTLVRVPGHRGTVRIDSGTGYTRSVVVGGGEAAALGHLREVWTRVRLAAVLLDTCGGVLAGRRVMNLGAGDGAEALCLFGMGAGHVTATNHGEHFLDGSMCARQRLLRTTFARHAATLGLQSTGLDVGVSWHHDDVTASCFGGAAFDLIFSWATLEHVLDPEAALREMYRILEPGGWAVHEYNPFFALDGGHSLCTLDIPWGHVRLDAEDFAAYVDRYHGADAPAALSFYRAGLNRMTIADLADHVRSAGFELAALVPRARTEDLLLLDGTMLTQARRQYPRVTVNDLASRMVRAVLRKPK